MLANSGIRESAREMMVECANRAFGSIIKIRYRRHKRKDEKECMDEETHFERFSSSSSSSSRGASIAQEKDSKKKRVMAGRKRAVPLHSCMKH